VPTRKIRAADSSRITVAGRPAPLSAAAVAAAARAVLAKEGRTVDLSVAFVGLPRMRELNRRWKGADRPTDVLAFPLEQPGGGLAGDVYICRAVAAREAASRTLPLKEELLRLVVHGTLHVLGYDHPEGTGRTRSSMWRRQERYLACLR
jgi:probable rRNA maturation factor